MPAKDEIPRAAGGGIVLLKAETYEKFRQACAVLGIDLDPADFETVLRGGKPHARLRDKATFPDKGGGGSGLLPFQITVTADTLKAAPGTLDGDSIAEVTKASPANGTWYLEAKVTINSTTGAVTATAMAWVSTPSSNTSTDFFTVIGEVDVVTGVPDAESIINYDFGPLVVAQYGTPTDKWGVLIF